MAAFTSNSAMAQGVADIGSLGGGGTSVNSLSADGTTVVGSSFNASTFRAFRWTAAGGLSDLGSFGSSTGASIAYGVSANGSVVVGMGIIAGGLERAFRWTDVGGMQDLGVLGGFAGSERSYANAVSGDGLVVTGRSTVADGSWNAFRWTSAGMMDIGRLPGGGFSEGRAISHDGSVIVGTSGIGSQPNSFHAIRWTSSEGMTDLGTLAGGRVSSGRGVSADGSVVVGTSENASFQSRAFRWTQAGGMQDLGVLAGSIYSAGFGVSANGQVVVGKSVVGGRDVAFRWTEATGMESVSSWLGAAGISTTGWEFLEAVSTSADGSVLAGDGRNSVGDYSGWIARVSALGSGVMSPVDYMRSVVAARKATLESGQQLSRFILWGSHHRPLMSYRDLGERGCFWATGDVGRRSNPSNIQDTLAEAGVCGDFAGRKIRAGFGLGYGKRSVGLGNFGSTRMSGNHVLAEVNARPEPGLLLSATAVHGRWKAETRRGYSGATGTDFSNGSARVESTAMRVRADWENLWMFGESHLTPYVAASIYRTRTGGYIETGGGFPARFDSQSQTELESRIGITGGHEITASTTLRPTVEAVYRSNRGTPRVRGQALGLFVFDEASTAQRRAWVRVGADIDHHLNKTALLSFSLHAASSGDDPRMSAALTFRMGF